MYLDRLEYRHDILSGFDSRCRLLSAFVLIIASIRNGNPALPVGIILFCLILLLRDIRVTLPRLLEVNVMVIALWLPVLIGVSRPEAAALYTLRVNAAALLYMVFVSSLSISAIAAAMIKLKVPPKLVSLFVLTWRYIFLLHEGFSVALASMRLRLRGAEQREGSDSTTIREWRALSAVFATALIRALLRAKKITAAMNARGFDGEYPVTMVFSWKAADSLLLAGSAAFLLISVIFIQRG
jgi:cobalt/nickel transport system permease protein